MSLETPYRLTIYEREHPQKRIVVLLGDSPPTPSAGGGGYQPITLPKRGAVTVWQGRDNPLLMDVPVVLAELPGVARPIAIRAGQPPKPAPPVSIARDRKRLIQWWRPDHETDEPPVLKLKAAGDAVPYQHLPWVLSDFTWGDATGNQRGNRTLQKLTLQFMEFREDERLHPLSIEKIRHRYQRTYQVKAGETLATIARRFKLKGGWRELGRAQHPKINDPRKIHAGQVLIIPSPAG